MISILLCIISFIACWYAGRRSLINGLITLIGIGYGYGIVRANIPQAFSHFIVDAAALGLYVAQLFGRLPPDQERKIRSLKRWVIFLSLWPILLFFVPVQDVLIEIVGLRGHIFLLPFLLLGARLQGHDLYKLTLWIAGFNLVAAGFGIAEFFLGVSRFFPYNNVTELIYRSTADTGDGSLRIPSCFPNAHAYGGVMATTLVFLLGAWMQKKNPRSHNYLLMAGIAASVLGVFMCAARLPVIIFLALVVTAIFSGKIRTHFIIGFGLILLGVGWLVMRNDRLQRFTTLGDAEVVTGRFETSVNKTFWDKAIEYPMGNGLGGGGTSIPYFLQDRIKNKVGIENEYGRILLEQGAPGLCLWFGFLIWLFTRRTNNPADSWYISRRLAWVSSLTSFAVGLIGTGLLTSLPGTCIMLLIAGWMTQKPGRVQSSSQVTFGTDNRNLIGTPNQIWVN